MNKELEQELHTVAESIYKDGYAEGYKKGKNERLTMCDPYNRGCSEAWECARKIANMTESKIIQAFGDWFGLSRILEKYSASEAMRKIKEWEEKQKQPDDEIKIGDEVEYTDYGDFGIVTFISNNDRYYVLDATGYWMANVCKDDVKKTGRSYPQIAEVLERLKGDDASADCD